LPDIAGFAGNVGRLCQPVRGLWPEEQIVNAAIRPIGEQHRHGTRLPEQSCHHQRGLPGIVAGIHIAMRRDQALQYCGLSLERDTHQAAIAMRVRGAGTRTFLDQ
jgi:hypothetical protein